jgi:thioredoxin-like negative regulator of GroEL
MLTLVSSVRAPSDLERLLAIHTTRSAPLITLWTATWCRSCAEISPLVHGLVEHEFVGLPQGGVGFVEVELDAPTIGDLGVRYAIRSVPTLMAFHRGEPRNATRVTNADDLSDRKFVTEWIESEAEVGKRGGLKGGKWLSGWFGS